MTDIIPIKRARKRTSDTAPVKGLINILRKQIIELSSAGKNKQVKKRKDIIKQLSKLK